MAARGARAAGWSIARRDKAYWTSKSRAKGVWRPPVLAVLVILPTRRSCRLDRRLWVGHSDPMSDFPPPAVFAISSAIQIGWHPPTSPLSHPTDGPGLLKGAGVLHCYSNDDPASRV